MARACLSPSSREHERDHGVMAAYESVRVVSFDAPFEEIQSLWHLHEWRPIAEPSSPTHTPPCPSRIGA